ncbi:MAG: CHAT domain-containing protein [Caldilineaceae bacterium]|nr:CHAT domain-containing protein [Caldilineaceae bacterium]
MNEIFQFAFMIVVAALVGIGVAYAAMRMAPIDQQRQIPKRSAPATGQVDTPSPIPHDEFHALKKEVEFWMSQYQLTQLELEQEKRGGLDIQLLQPKQSSPIETPSKLSILAIWPVQNDLNLQASRDALYNAGVSYLALNGTVTMADIVDEFSRNDFNALELGTHGKRLELASHGLEGGIWLSDGIASPGWWARLATFQKLKLAVVLACESLQTGEALLHAGVEHVIAVQGMIEDTAAVKFSFLFYKYVAAGKSISTAFDLAKLALTRDQAETLRLLARR